MVFEELAASRYSLRSFAQTPVEAEKVQRILEVCRLAPTACNNQPQRILVIDEAGALEKLKACTGSHFGAPLAMLVCYDKTVAWQRQQDGHTSGEVDASIVGTHLMIQAAALGLGSCWVMNFDPAAIIAQFGLPPHLVPVALFPLGYPTAQAKPSHLHNKRRPVEDMVTYQSFA